MKKYFTPLLISFLMATQPLIAQLDMAFISDFTSISNNAINRLSWTVSKNHGVKNFYVERSTNGIDFKTVAVLKATEKFNTERYQHSDTITGGDLTMYRLKVVSKTQYVFYSRIVLVKSKLPSTYGIKIIGNPVKDQLSFNYNPKNVQQAYIRIYDLWGKVVLNQKISCFTGTNFITIPLNSDFTPGMYVMEITNGIMRQTEKFIKQ